jgi:hypothetical protein
MSGQSASLSLAEAKAMQECVQASGSHASNHGGSKKSGGSKKGGTPIDKKVAHQG